MGSVARMDLNEEPLSVPGLDGLFYTYYRNSGNMYVHDVCCTTQFRRDLNGEVGRENAYTSCDYLELGLGHLHPEGEGILIDDIKRLGVLLGVTVRCVLSRTTHSAGRYGARLATEYDLDEAGWREDEVADTIRPHLDTIVRCMVDRKIIVRLGTDTAGNVGVIPDLGLHVNFNSMDAALEAYARAYEWENWPDLLSYLGIFNIKRILVYSIC